jgi:hypothetical protein
MEFATMKHVQTVRDHPKMSDPFTRSVWNVIGHDFGHLA